MATSSPLTVEQQKIGLFASPNYSQYTQNTVNDDNPQNNNVGAGVQSGDGGADTSQKVNAKNNLNTNKFIEPQGNILDKFYSYTWQASVYLMTSKQYTQLVRSRRKNVSGYNLLFQSGGAPVNKGGFQGRLNPDQQTPTTASDAGSVNNSAPGGSPGATQPDAGRNPAFPQDFYIESITIDNQLPGKLTNSPHMVTDLKFTVIEPGNITLLDRLYEAVQDAGALNKEGSPINYTATQYLMVIRWYGYDEAGNLVAGKTAPDPKTGLTDTNAVVEKFIPFLIKKINWSVGTKLVSYDFECAPVGQMIGGNTRRGTIPYDVQLSGGTVSEFLAGDLVYTDSANADATVANDRQTASNTTAFAYPSGVFAPPKANATPKKQITQGLMAAMNEFQQKLVQDGIYQKADTYSLAFTERAKKIANASLVIPGSIVDKSSTDMGPSTSENATQALDQNKSAVKATSRNQAITAGQQLIQVIDAIVRNSRYILDQSLTTYNADNIEVATDKALKEGMQWFNVTFEATPGEYDYLRNDYVYDIKFVIDTYEIPNFDSKYFPLSNFRGTHKRYPFWFTGENTAVLDFQANFNSLYNMTVSGGPNDDNFISGLRKKYSSQMRDIVKYTYAPASTESRKGADGRSYEPAANAAENLYATPTPGGTTVRIIGDPAWIQQGSLAGGVSPEEFGLSGFLPDGTINFDSSQIMFEILWQRPSDYNLSTGLADPYARPGNQSRQAQQSTVYQAIKCVSEFRGGKFEQILTGALYLFPVPNGSNTVAGATGGVSGPATNAASLRAKLNAADSQTGTTAGTGSERPNSSVAGSGDLNIFAGTGASPLQASTDYGRLQAAQFQSAGGASAMTLPGNDILAAVQNPIKSFTSIAPTPILASAGYPQAPTGSGVTGLTLAQNFNGETNAAVLDSITNGPKKITKNFYNNASTQIIAKDA